MERDHEEDEVELQHMIKEVNKSCPQMYLHCLVSQNKRIPHKYSWFKKLRCKNSVWQANTIITNDTGPMKLQMK